MAEVNLRPPELQDRAAGRGGKISSTCGRSRTPKLQYPAAGGGRVVPPAGAGVFGGEMLVSAHDYRLKLANRQDRFLLAGGTGD